MARASILLATALALLTWAWLGLEGDAEPFVNVGKTIGLALVPAVVVAGLRGRLRPVLVALAGFAALVLCALTAASVSFELPLTEMRRGEEHDFFGPLFSSMAAGFRDVYETDPGFARSDHPELASLILFALFGFAALVGLALAAGRHLVAGLLLLVGVGGPATIAAAVGQASPLRTGALTLAALLLLLFVSRPAARPLRGLGPALGVGAAVVLVALGASTSPAVAKDAFLAWRDWDLYDAPSDPVGVRYVWTSNYAGISFPETETVVLRIKGPERDLYWRATTLDEFTGVGWREDLDTGPPLDGLGRLDGEQLDPSLPSAAAADDASLVRNQVTVVALADNHLIAPPVPVRWLVDPAREYRYAPGGVVFQPEGLEQGQVYTVWSYAPEVQPRELARLPARYPGRLGRFLEVVPDIRLPAFGTEGRHAAVEELFAERSFDALLVEYEPVYRLARELVGDAESPYVAAATLETWFRGDGSFVYEEQPEQPIDSTPPLVDFVLRTREGYCQQYAGAMAVMLRLLGIPARVAVGFTSGEYDDRRGEWAVTDHNAHAWVEVWFPRYGWLSFDPTPGRGELGAAYSTSSQEFPAAEGADALGLSPEGLSAILRERLLGIEAGQGALGGEGSGGTLRRTQGGGLPLAVLVPLLVLGTLGLLLATKEARRRLRFRSGDPRAVGAACRRDLVGFLADQGQTVSSSSTVAELGRFLGQRYGVDARRFVQAVDAARFGSPRTAADAASGARRELRELRRDLRGQLAAGRRALGAVNLRSLLA